MLSPILYASHPYTHFRFLSVPFILLSCVVPVMEDYEILFYTWQHMLDRNVKGFHLVKN